MKNTLVMLELRDYTLKEMKEIPGFDFRFVKPEEAADEDLAWAQVIVGDPSMEQIGKAKQLEWIQTDSAGVNSWKNLDEHITLSNAYGAYGEGIGEFLTAEVLMADKQLDRYVKAQKEHSWENLGYGIGVRNMKVLSVGMGAIGSAFLRRMHALGAACYGVCRTVHEKPDVVEALYTTEHLNEILPEADVIALSLPETPQTIHMFDYDRLHLMKKNAMLLNVGRGSAIDETALLKVLEEGWFSRVLLDVTEHEPLPKNNALWNIDRVFITPHISGRFHNPINYDAVASIILENLKLASEGKPLKHVVQRSIGY